MTFDQFCAFKMGKFYRKRLKFSKFFCPILKANLTKIDQNFNKIDSKYQLFFIISFRPKKTDLDRRLKFHSTLFCGKPIHPLFRIELLKPRLRILLCILYLSRRSSRDFLVPSIQVDPMQLFV